MKSTLPWARLGVWMVALLLLWGVSERLVRQLHAQEGGENAANAEGAAGDAPDDAAGDEEAARQSVGGMIVDGSGFGLVFYIVLGLFSLAAVTVALERAVNLKRSKVLPEEFARRLGDLAGRNELSGEKLRDLSESSNTPVGRILQAGVVRAGRPLPEVEKAMEDSAAREMAEMRSRNRPLSVVGSVAPLVGLLGTVVGMIFAFQVSSQEGLGKAERLAEGIYLALMTTALGLTIAIPCLLLAAWFNGRVERFMREIDVCLLDTLPTFTRLEAAAHSQSRTAAKNAEDVIVVESDEEAEVAVG